MLDRGSINYLSSCFGALSGMATSGPTLAITTVHDSYCLLQASRTLLLL